jgi:hypothetical protein
MPADAEQILAGGIDGDDPQVLVENEDAGIEVVDDVEGERAVDAAGAVAGTAGTGWRAYPPRGLTTVVCCT